MRIYVNIGSEHRILTLDCEHLPRKGDHINIDYIMYYVENVCHDLVFQEHTHQQHLSHGSIMLHCVRST